MSQQLPDLLVINGHISADTYRSLKDHLMPPVGKLIFLVLLVAYNLFLLWQMIVSGALLYLAIMVFFSALLIIFYQRSKKATVKRIIASRKELREGIGFDLNITLSRNGIHLFNNTTGRERNLQWKEFVSMYESELCIALFVRKNNYLMLPKDHMDEAKRAQTLAMIHACCPNMKKRW